MDTKDSRPTTFHKEKTVRRRRHCRDCLFRITTFEVIGGGRRDAELKKIAAMREAVRRATEALQLLLSLNGAIDRSNDAAPPDLSSFGITNGAPQ